MTRSEIETRLQEILDKRHALERALRNAPDNVEDHRSLLALEKEQRTLEGCLRDLDQAGIVARSG